MPETLAGMREGRFDFHTLAKLEPELLAFINLSFISQAIKNDELSISYLEEQTPKLKELYAKIPRDSIWGFFELCGSAIKAGKISLPDMFQMSVEDLCKAVSTNFDVDPDSVNLNAFQGPR